MPFPTLPDPLARALAGRAYAEPTPVQAAVLAEEAAGRDLLVSAQTGSGKTVAFGLALAPELLAGQDRVGRAGAPLALAIAPTRELALQVRDELTWLYTEAGARVAACVGGTDPRAERRALEAGAHIVVGTPGRLRDHLERGNLDLSGLRAVVLDEADEMLDMGFKDELEAILDATPETRRTLLFSATIPREIASLAKQYQKDALRIAAGGEAAHRDIAYQAVAVAPRETERALVNLLRWHGQRAIVFCSTRAAVARVHGNLTERGFNAVALSGELTQAERNRALQALRDRRAEVCVATDVAARGIDLPDLGLVVHAELPRDAETLLHRSGRTGRAGRKGLAVLLVPYPRRRIAERLLATARVRAEWGAPPSAEEIRRRDGEKLVQQAIEAAAAAAAEPEALALGKAVLEAHGAEAVAAALVKALGASLPAPEEIEAAEPEPRQAPRPPRGEGPGPGPAGEGAWFRLNIGRAQNADPRWLLPFLCRRGHLVRGEVGRILVMDRETRVEIAPWAASRFAAAARHAGEDDEDILIEPMRGGAAPTAPRAPRGAPPRSGDGPVKRRG